MSGEEVSGRVYAVVSNDEGEHALWPVGRPMPLGWVATGFTGSRRECLDHVTVVWTDMRPKSVRRVLADKPGTSRWLVGQRKRAEPADSLYCFPHSGGSPGEFVRWPIAVSGMQIFGVQLPGRGGRIDESPRTSMSDLVEAITSGIQFEAPFSFFGHSLGALVCFETARELRSRGLVGPNQLIVSACPAPEYQIGHEPLHRMTDDDLIDAVDTRYGGLPDELRHNRDLLDLVLPAYRADFQVLEEYRLLPGEPLDIPITVLAGIDDRVSLDLLFRWRDYTTGEFDLRMFPGGHFYLREPQNTTAFYEFLKERVSVSTRPVSRSRRQQIIPEP